MHIETEWCLKVFSEASHKEKKEFVYKFINATHSLSNTITAISIIHLLDKIEELEKGKK